MLSYWITFIIFSFGSLSRRFYVDRRLGPVLGATLVALTLFVGLRYKVGADWGGYELIYRRAALQDWSRFMSYGDRGFNALVLMLKGADLGIWSLNLVCATIFMVGLGAFARQMPNPWLAVTVAMPYLIFVVAMSGIRQAAAIGLFYLAINAYRDRRLVAAVGWLLIASSFHASAILMLGVAGLSFSRSRFQSAIIICVTLLVGYYVLSSSFDVYNIRYGKHQIESSGTIYRILMNTASAVPYLMLQKYFPVDGEHEATLWRNMSWLSVLCIPALAVVSSTTALDRFSLYLIPLQTYVFAWLPFVLAKKEENERIYTLLILLYLSLILFVFLNFALNAKSSVPYRFYLFSGE
jgi:hypothetical protein